MELDRRQFGRLVVALAAGGLPGRSSDSLAVVETMTTEVLQIGLGGVAAGSGPWHAAFAVGLLLFAGTYGLNLAGAWLRNRGRERRS